MVFFLFRSRAAKQGVTGIASAGAITSPRRQNLDYQPRAKPVSPLRPPVAPAGTRYATLPPPKSMSVVAGRRDITDSMQALVIKYMLDGFTLATEDGLVFASGGDVDATGDAAKFGGAPGLGMAGDKDGVTLFTVTCMGSNLTGILRSNLPLPAGALGMIEADTQEILNRWI